MNAALAVSNFAVYSLQAAVLIGTGMLALRLLRIARPLVFLQVLLAVVVLLPGLQRWEHPQVRWEPVATARIVLPAAALQRVDRGAPVNWAAVGLDGLGLGALLRFAWLGVGLMRLRQLRRNAHPIGDGLAVSADIAGPVTFGLWRPLIVLPPAVLEMPEGMRAAILAHERAHVGRRDWAYAVCEELVLCVLWFHPALWWLVSRIRLVREQVVDLEASREAGSREVYVDALLAVAGARMQPYFAPAPPFLRRRQLASRVRALVTEVPMSKFRLIASYSAAAACTLLLGVWTMNSYPLRGAPQAVTTPENVTVEGAELVYATRPVYPVAARNAGVTGPVTVEVTVAANGEVADARVIAGAQELRKAALDSVLHWQFRPVPGVARVVIQFRAEPVDPAAGNMPKLVSLAIDSDIAAPLAETLRRRLQPFLGQRINQEMAGIVQRLDPSLTFRTDIQANADVPEMRMTIMRRGSPTASSVAAPGRIRVAGAVQAANLLVKPEPAYPPIARQARIQGTVRFNVAIGKDGDVIAIELVSGHPLLVPAASEALRQYRYKPTLLNGQPAEVQSEADVVFRLP